MTSRRASFISEYFCTLTPKLEAIEPRTLISTPGGHGDGSETHNGAPHITVDG